MKKLRLPVSIALLLTIIFFGFQSIAVSRHNQKLKKEYAELNHFKYGLFNVDAWKEKLSVILSDEIDDFSFKGGNQKAIQKQLESQLTILIEKMVQRIKKANSKDAGGWFKQSVLEGLVDIKDLKKGVPEYAQAMMKELSKPKNEAMIKDMVKEKADEFLQKTYAHVDDRQRQEQIERLGASNGVEAKDKLNKEIHHNRELLNKYAMIIIALASLLFVMEGLSKGTLRQTQYFILVTCLFVLVAVGVTTPMIDIEAKISHLGFTILDHPIAFDNQVVFFQSKSILDVFHIMISHKDPLMKVVGVLIVCFSVVFPLCKLASTLAFYYDYCRARSKRLIKFFVLHSGKWSMADVLVVGIFMAYIGFNGVINGQLDSLKESGKGLDLLTTNGTQLQPGYFVFMTYAILALFLSSFLSSRPCYKDTTSENPDIG